ncbi:MAG TPA: HAMP domain-containing sensor histidine kinase [Vicinamibacterales bacterium]|jgi:two-component system sensor histidine kinase BaeS|nr:HAMP domain-containing sensor histidine kinase [Vicinamibacterales bacterium]
MRWYRSLYWRIAVGVVAFLAAMLVVQAMLFVWAVSQSGRSLQGQSPGRFAMTIALDLSNLLERDPHADLAQYVREQYAQYEHPFFAMMSDGRLITSGSKSFPEPLLRLARARLERGDIGRGPRLDGALRPDGAARPEGPRAGARESRDGRGGPSGLRFGGDRFDRIPSAIVVGGQLAGVVVVPTQAPFGFLLGRYAPMLTLVAVGVLVVGTVLTSALIFSPARRRLRALEKAAQQLGAGDLSARAPERGGDEIAAVASAFNAMATDLSARADALAASDRLRRQLLADVSHELNTPVTAMRGYLETLTMPELTLDEGTRARYLAIIGDETARLERLIGDLLELARLEGGGGSLHVEPVAVDQLFARVTARHERASADAGVQLRTSIAAGAETVACDRERMEQALQNLAANAVRHAPTGTAVGLVAKATAEDVRLAVEDEGDGIAPAHLPHVFDRFYKADASRPFAHRSGEARQGDGHSAATGGSGLGLSIVKAIVERHGGSITVRSRPGCTVFEITLPRGRTPGTTRAGG